MRDHDTTRVSASVGDARQRKLPRAGLASLPSTVWEFLLSPAGGLLAVLLFAFALYAPSLNDWFQTDDFIYLRAAQLNHSPDQLLHAWNFYGHHTVFLYQPLYEVGIISEAELFGLRAWPYHFVSLLLHLTNGVLLWLIVAKVTRRPLVAHLAALIFLVHPTYVSAVAWISDQVALSATAFALVCFLAFIKSLELGSKVQRWYAISVASYLAAMLFHPKAASVLVALVAYYFFVHSADLRALLSRRAWLRFAPYVAVAMFPLVAGLWLRQHDVAQQTTFRYGPHVYRNYVDYLRVALIPDPWLRGARPGAVACVAWLGIGLWLLRDARYRGAAVLGLAWLVAALLPLTTSLLGASNRELYITGPAVALTLALFSVSLLDWLPKRVSANMLAVAALIVLLALAGRRTLKNEDVMAGYAGESHNFIEQLRATYPALPPNASVYVVGPPLILHIFGDIHLNWLGQIYYGDIELHTVSEADAEAIEHSGQANAFVFRYVPH